MLKVTYMFMALAIGLVVLFIAELLQIFRQNFYSNTFCFSLLCLYLGNSQVSVYRTIGPTLVFYLFSLQLVLCRVAALKIGPVHRQ